MKRVIHANVLSPGFVQFNDSCNVYVISDGESCIAIDYGSGDWVDQLGALGLGRLEHVYLTHHHADQCVGLEGNAPRDFVVHAPAVEKDCIDPASIPALHRPRIGVGLPLSFTPLSQGIDAVCYDMAGNTDHFWHKRRLRFIDTPGHGRGAVSIVADVGNQQVVFCGDAAHDGATIHQPYHLEWDHWTGEGALAAFDSVARLANIGMDLLCPSHGKVIADKPRAMLKTLARKLLAFYEVKGNICAGEPDHYLEPSRRMHSGAWQLLPSLYKVGMNSYLVVDASRDALLVDPNLANVGDIDALLGELGNVTLTDMIATHYHCDHVDGAQAFMDRGVKLHLHPRVAEPLAEPEKFDVPFKIDHRLRADHLLPNSGIWSWRGHRFRVAPFPGQTWWHAAHMTEIDGQNVLFGGDSFQPNSRWNGTGGFSSFNGCHFTKGFAQSAQMVMDWKPDLIVNGHGTFIHYHASHFRRIIQWARRAEKATAALCLSGNLQTDYYLHDHAEA